MLERWRLILRYLPRYKRAILVGVGAIVLSNAAMVVAPLAGREAIRAIEVPWRSKTSIELGPVALWAALALLITVVGALTSFFKRYLLMRTSRRVETDLRRDLFGHIQRLPMAYFDRTRTGDLMSRATADIEAARLAIGPAFMYLSDSFLRFGFALAVLLYANATLTLYALGPLLGICAGLFLLAPRIHQASRRVQDQLAAISARAQESFAGGRVVKTYATEDREGATMDALGRDYIAANLGLARVRALTTAWLALMGAGGILIIVYVGGRQVIEGRFGIAGMVMFISLQMMLIWPMMAFGWVLSMVQRGAAGVDRIKEVFDQPVESDRGRRTRTLRGEIEFRDLSFAYDGRPILCGVSLHVPAGSTLGIIGPTGSGKSTLVSLLVRLYEAPPGSLFIDGSEIHDIALTDLRAAAAIVPQEAFLFSTTIKDNIAFGRPAAADDWLARAAEDAHLHRDLEEFESGLDTIVGERGVTLSGGQKQRAALARALAADAPILILDDALSAVDTETEAAILANLKRVGARRTVLVVAHRVSALRHADRIIYMRDGRVTESGTHEELVALGGEYARLNAHQELEAQIDGMQP